MSLMQEIFVLLLEWLKKRFYVLFCNCKCYILPSRVVKTLLSISVHRAQNSTKSPPNNIRKQLKRWKQSSSKFLTHNVTVFPVLDKIKVQGSCFLNSGWLVVGPLEYLEVYLGIWVVRCIRVLQIQGKGI